jgi:Uma2 family endonuclease
MATGTELLTAEEYMALPGSFDGPVELVKGVLSTIPPPSPRHGEICFRVAYLIQRYLDDHPIGRVVTNDSSVLTERDPDSVRGPDVAYYSFERVPAGPFPSGLSTAAPELVVEVRSPGDRWRELHTKIAEYLGAGVRSVCVLDDETKSVHAFHADQPSQVFNANDELTLPEILGDFRVVLRRFFE